MVREGGFWNCEKYKDHSAWILPRKSMDDATIGFCLKQTDEVIAFDRLYKRVDILVEGASKYFDVYQFKEPTSVKELEKLINTMKLLL
jgi:hypothetical protein